MLEAGFSLTDHCCRTCAGRVLVRNGEFMCATCEARGTAVEAVCACGMRAAGNDLPKRLKGAYKCAVNPGRSVVSPARIVVTYGGEVVQPLAVS